jgi:hypothetical protein
MFTVITLALFLATPDAAVRAQAQQPVDDVAQWISAHPRVMQIWDQAFRYPRENLTPSTRRCIDNSRAEAVFSNSSEIFNCAKIGAREVGAQRKVADDAAVARLTAITLKSDGDAAKAQWISAHPLVMRRLDLIASVMRRLAEIDTLGRTTGFSRDLLTPSARRCIDNSDGDATKGEVLFDCAKIGEREVFLQRLVAGCTRDGCWPVGTLPSPAEVAEARAKWMGAVFGAEVVFVEDSRDEAKAEIAKQKKYSRYGGVISKTELYASQQEIRAADEKIDGIKALAEAAHVKVLRRTHKQTLEAHACIVEHGDDINEVIRAAHSFAVKGQDCLWILILYVLPE